MTDLRSRLGEYVQKRGAPEGAPRDPAADSALRELVSRIEGKKNPVEEKPAEVKPEAEMDRGQNPVLKTEPTVVTGKAASVEVAKEKGPKSDLTKQPTKSALAREMEAMGLDFTKPEDYATYQIAKLIDGEKPLPQEKPSKKKTGKVDKEAESRLAEDLAREESKARKRVEEEKARDEQPEVEPEGEEGKSPKSEVSETTRDSKKKLEPDGKSEEILTPEKPTHKAKKSAPITPEQATKEALWKFQAAHAEGERGSFIHASPYRITLSSPSQLDFTGSRKKGSANPTSSSKYCIRAKLQGAHVMTIFSWSLFPPRAWGTI